MKLKSKYLIKNITLKDVILLKDSSYSITTESYLKIPPQPYNTCPLIDKAISDNDLLIRGFEATIRENKDFTKNIDLSCNCMAEEAYKSNVTNFKEVLEGFENLNKSLSKMNEFLEEFRKNCEEIREHGRQTKEALWDHLEDGNGQQKKNRPEEIEYDFNALYRDMEPSFPKYIEGHCSDRCEYFIENEKLEHSFAITKVYLPIPNSLKDAVQNYQDLITWAKKIDHLFNDAEKIPDTSDFLKNYLEKINEEQEDNFKRWSLPVKPTFEPEQELKAYLDSTEDLIKVKRLSEQINAYNKIILNYPDKEDSSQVEAFLIEVEDLKEKIDVVNAPPAVMVKIKGILTQLSQSVRTNTRQKFKIV